MTVCGCTTGFSCLFQAHEQTPVLMESFVRFDSAKVDLFPRLDVLWADMPGCVRLKVMSWDV